MKTPVILALFFALACWAGPVSHFGYLQACKVGGKGQLCGSLTDGSPVIVKGPSLYWSAGKGGTFYNRRTVDWFVDEMQIGVIRAAMAIKYYKENSEGISQADGSNCSTCYGYLSSGVSNAKSDTKAMIQNVIDAAVANDIYVIVDWHSHNANNEKSEAVAFFKEMAQANPDVPNIIWEVYNEPVNDSSSTIKSYAEAVISGLRSVGNKNLVIVGSNYYSQNPQQQASAGTSDSQNNVAYSFHFYAATHSPSGSIWSSAQSAMNAGHAVYATEWGSVNADGGGTPNSGQSQTWYTQMENNNIGGCYWSASEIDEGASIFAVGTTTTLTTSGNLFKTYMGTKKWTTYIPSGDPKGNDVHASVNEGAEKTWTSELGLTGTIESAEMYSGPGEVSFTSSSITYKSLEWGSSQSPYSSPAQAYIIYKVKNGSKTVQARIAIDLANLKPILPKLETILVSHKAPANLGLRKALGAKEPDNSKTIVFSAAEVSGNATVRIVSDTIIEFTPPASIANGEQGFTLTYSVKNSSNAVSTQTVELYAQNMVPIVTPGKCCNRANTEAFNLSVKQLGGSDADNDSIWFAAYYLHPDYPGTLEKVTADTLRYTPEAGKTGTIRILVAITDGIEESNVGSMSIGLTGSGTAITNDPNPSEIPDYTPIVPAPVLSGNFSVKVLNGRILVENAPANAKISVFDMKGNAVGFNVRHGMYIVKVNNRVKKVVVR